MAIDQIRFSRSSFETVFLRKEDNVILRTESGRRISIKRIVPSEWSAYRVYDYERDLNDNKRNIQLIDRNFLSQIEKDLIDKLR